MSELAKRRDSLSEYPFRADEEVYEGREHQ